ncbi:cytochrome c oxidase subunit 8A, mitochondrial [Eucyclogobius newberryi]|uniref:cytochrome c oxidase subunit 8A, mitochondrial n=1 Tax=Eucyclogobius newberryi TaxID=166745 RepID=UPI003B5B13C4
MSGILRVLTSRVAPVVRTQTANLGSKPAQEKIGVMETTVALGLFSLAILGPSGWILAHLEDYKKKD